MEFIHEIWAMRMCLLLGTMMGWGLLLPGIRAQATDATPVRLLGAAQGKQEKPLMRIGLIADAQYCDCDASHERYYRIALEKLDQAVDTFNAQRVDMVINLGDLIDQQLPSYHLALQALERLQMPVHNVLGNHEFWGVPFQLQQSVLDTLGLANGYCELLFPGWRMLLLDGTELAEYAQGAHRDLSDEAELCRGSLLGHTNAALWNGAIGQEQMAWMDWQLSQADAAGERVLLFCHFPISPPGHGMTLWNEADLRLQLARHPSAEAWLAGHSHFGSYEFLQAVHHVTLTGMLMSPDSNAFAILNLYPDRLELEGFGREPSRVMPLHGSSAVADTVLPQPGIRPDAVPPRELPCLERRVLDLGGQTIFSEATDSLGAAQDPSLPAGIFEMIEEREGKFAYRRIVVFPK